jgi:hypothetical protein
LEDDAVTVFETKGIHTNCMDYIGKLIRNFRDFYNEISAVTLTGAM